MKEDKAVRKFCLRADKKIDEVCEVLDHGTLVDTTGVMTDEELNAMRYGALSAYTFARALMGGLGEPEMRKAYNMPAPAIAKKTIVAAATGHAKKFDLEY